MQSTRNQTNQQESSYQAQSKLSSTSYHIQNYVLKNTELEAEQQNANFQKRHDDESQDSSYQSSEQIEQEPIKDQDQKESQNLSQFSDYQIIQDEDSFQNFQDPIQPQQAENVAQYIKDQDQIFQNFQQKQQKKQGIKANISLRSFQKNLIQNSQDKNSIVYLPTGTGKTRIAICSMYYYLSKFGTQKKIVFLANTIQLVKQQTQAIKYTFKKIILNQSFARQLRQKLGTNYVPLNWTEKDIDTNIVCIHGQKNEDQASTKRKSIISSMNRKKELLKEMKRATITVMISQMFLNCLRRGYIKLEDYSFMIFDQCHHCEGDHPYSGIMKEFYFEQKLNMIKNQKKNRVNQDVQLPVIMGLTASPVIQPCVSHELLKKQLIQLCINLDSNFAYYPIGQQIKNKTQIQIRQIKLSAQKAAHHDLLDYFQIHKDHEVSYQKLKIHFPAYFKCIEEVINKMAGYHIKLSVQVKSQQLTDVQHFLFYDIKQTLLLKLRDVWLQLGQFAFFLAFSHMVKQLKNYHGMRTQQNKKLLEQIKDLLIHYEEEFRKQFGQCKQQFMSNKLVELIKILKPAAEDIKKNKVSDMVLVFAFKRRTVKFLNQVIDNYYKCNLEQDQQKFYNSVGVTGYGGRQKQYRTNIGSSFQPNPSSNPDNAELTKLYEQFEQKQRQKMVNNIHTNSILIDDNKTLKNQLSRMILSKMNKLFLQVEQKYSQQLKKITDFKKKLHRILITTSVTQEGFDIPGCNLVISFDTPFSLKSYIQIKGRARKKDSKYIIFTNQSKQNAMKQNRQNYDSNINAIYQIAINQISKTQINALKYFKKSQNYQKVKTKGGALLNSNYALSILKSYFAGLKQPNNPYIHFYQTSNICFKCVIKFPQTSTSKIDFVCSQPLRKKDQALKSAAFSAVKKLKKEGLLKDDLRPSKLQQLQDQLQLQKYDDLGTCTKDKNYRQIFEQYVRIFEANNENKQKRLVRFYFKHLQPIKIQFHFLNRDFNKVEKQFQENKKSYKYPFQIYHIKFLSKKTILEERQNSNQFGILTCFEEEELNTMFLDFKRKLDKNCNQEFQLRYSQHNLMLTKEEFDKLKLIHNFLITSHKNNQIQFYNYLNNQPPVMHPKWANLPKKFKINKQINYYPIFVLLKKHKNTNQYKIDQQLNNKIFSYMDLFKKLYVFHNKGKVNTQKQNIFDQNLRDNIKVLQDKINQNNDHRRNLVLQSIHKSQCFFKCLIASNLTPVYQQLQKKKQKAEQKKKKLKNHFDPLRRSFAHIRQSRQMEQELILNFVNIKKIQKQDMNEIFNKHQFKLKKLDQVNSSNWRFLKQYVLFPLSYPALFKLAVIMSKNIYQIIQDYCIALYFRKFFLNQIFDGIKKKKIPEKYTFKYYNSVILDNYQQIFQHLVRSGHNRYLRDLGRVALQKKSGDISFLGDQQYSEILPQNQSMISKNNESFLSSQLNFSNINKSVIACQKILQLPEEQLLNSKDSNQVNSIKSVINLSVLDKLNVQDILRSLTSKMYNHEKKYNYQQFEFIGDVVLKYLATLQIFLQKNNLQQGEMHISRANIICNANLHRQAIKHKIFQFILTKKQKKQILPLIDYNSNKIQAQQQMFQNTQRLQIKLLKDQSNFQGYQYIPSKVHADVVQALIGIFFLRNKNLEDCQTFLFAIDILKKPTLQIKYQTNNLKNYTLPKYFQNIQNILNYTFKKKQLLVQAFTHSSFISIIEDVVDYKNNKSFSILFNQNINTSKISQSQMSNMSMLPQQKQVNIKKHQTCYQRLQFLGDAFLDLIVVEYIYDKGGQYLDDQGTLSFLKQTAVSNKTLGFIALKIGIFDKILLNMDNIDAQKKEFQDIYRKIRGLPTPYQFSQLKIGSLKILGDIFESIIGAILIDNQFKYQQTKQVIMNIIGQFIKHFTSESFIKQCPSYKYKQYFDENNYKKPRLKKVIQEGILDGQYFYKLFDSLGNEISQGVRACNEKDAWDKLMDSSLQKKKQ